ncbi:hypothetical protein MUB15_08365 [Priestia sp. OVS21]|nr:hypothetical protein [Priestia sp. OVS21]
MEELFRVEQTMTLNINDENLYNYFNHFEQGLQNRIKNYIIERKRDFVFERPEFMFWILKKEEDLLHKPETIQSYNNHVYFTYEDLKSGQKKVRIASKQVTHNVIQPLLDLQHDFEQIDKKDMTLTEKEQVIKARIGHSAFKQGLLKRKRSVNFVQLWISVYLLLAILNLGKTLMTRNVLI